MGVSPKDKEERTRKKPGRVYVHGNTRGGLSLIYTADRLHVLNVED